MLWNSRNISLYQLRNKEANLSTREITGGNKIQYPNPVMPLTLQVSATTRSSLQGLHFFQFKGAHEANVQVLDGPIISNIRMRDLM